MWPFTKSKLVQPEDLPEAIDSLAEKLRNAHFVVEADRFHYLVHEFVATTSDDLYGELHFALKTLDHEHRALPRDIANEIRHLIKSIDKICGRR